jgi:hypothetical protein
VRKLPKDRVEQKTRKPPNLIENFKEYQLDEYFRLRQDFFAGGVTPAPMDLEYSETTILKLRQVGTFEYLTEWFIDPYTLELYNDHTDESLFVSQQGGYTVRGMNFILRNQSTPRRLPFSKVKRKPRKQQFLSRKLAHESALGEPAPSGNQTLP